ncbi:UNVERIFIED_CONTAM: B-box zinc finger protein 21 [Sesamum angustifolium]|uniref:B-box zinc finger protein 21 n=1 Tax=Sesamum angustifolium TaxID=2727405 RepID=A0AAW2M826_9LAMI
MKVQCDACHVEMASIFCYIDKIALCSTCNRHVHHHNLIAKDHQHIQFSYPLPNPFLICDICQESKAFIFCREHRVITYRLCDISLHANDELKKQHNRFLLSIAKLCNNVGDNQVGNDESGASTTGRSNTNPKHVEGEGMVRVGQRRVDASSYDPYGLCKVTLLSNTSPTLYFDFFDVYIKHMTSRMQSICN